MSRRGPSLCAVLLLSACGSEAEPTAAQRVGLPGAVVTPCYAGEIVLRGDPLLDEPGAVQVSIQCPGTDASLYSRAWELGDPFWRESHGERRLYFRIDERDRDPGADGQAQETMDLVARWDPDGNPATAEPAAVSIVQRVRTGAADIVVDLRLGQRVLVAPAADRAEPDGG